MCILPDTVNASIFNPPDTALYQITSYMAVTLVKIRHYRSKPPVSSNLLFECTGVNIHYAGRFKRSLNVIRAVIKPIFRRFVSKQVVFTSAMIKNHIHHYFQILFMCFLYQCTEIFITSKPSVNLIIVCNGISMIGTTFHIIFLSRIQPDCCHS